MAGFTWALCPTSYQRPLWKTLLDTDSLHSSRFPHGQEQQPAVSMTKCFSTLWRMHYSNQLRLCSFCHSNDLRHMRAVSHCGRDSSHAHQHLAALLNPLAVSETAHLLPHSPFKTQRMSRVHDNEWIQTAIDTTALYVWHYSHFVYNRSKIQLKTSYFSNLFLWWKAEFSAAITPVFRYPLEMILTL